MQEKIEELKKTILVMAKVRQCQEKKWREFKLEFWQRFGKAIYEVNNLDFYIDYRNFCSRWQDTAQGKNYF